MMKHIPFALALGLLFVNTAKADMPADKVIEAVAFDQRLGAQLPLDLVFRNEQGQSVRLGSYFGQKPVILSLVYYECPMLCTLVLNGIVRSLRALPFHAGKEFQVVSVSINPLDTPALAAEKKRSYMKIYGRSEDPKGWAFLTGDEASIRSLASTVGFKYIYDPVRKEYAHAGGIMVITPTGKVSRYFYGVEYDGKDLKWGLMESSKNKIGSRVDQLLLLCYHYDPTTGKYGVAIMRFMRLGALLTLGALGFFIIRMLRREQRLRAA